MGALIRPKTKMLGGPLGASSEPGSATLPLVGHRLHSQVPEGQPRLQDERGWLDVSVVMMGEQMISVDRQRQCSIPRDLYWR